MDINRMRQETPGCLNKIFLNSAGGSLMPDSVVETMTRYLEQEKELGAYETAARNTQHINRFYEETAKLLNCNPSNIAFVTSSTDAYSKALSSIPFQKDDCIITTDDDYISNQLAFLSLQKREGVKVIRMKNLPDHELDLEDLDQLIKTHKPKLIAVTQIPTNSGLIQNVEGVGKICKQYDILYLVDACQSVGQLPVDAKAIGCDFLTATGRKFIRGPRGTGLLYVSDKVLQQDLVPLFLDTKGATWVQFDDYEIGTTAKRFEHWETSMVNLLGLTEAIRYANSVGLDYIEKYNKNLSSQLRKGLQDKGLKVLDEGNHLGSIVTFCEKDGKIENAKKVLEENNVFFSLSNKQNALINFTHKNVDSAIRLSPHYFNTHEEMEQVVRLLSSL
ncbi:aminotransferase class V-fold PLP-dependent enzyme [Chryseobacterium sp. CT-SW4]|uniref:aminotransferase class V-fold PLP-dependent enzyme n=1 Tax=Chryseobacterium sp. SW-1 TaxID=3157343 RepID=UPI003B02CC9C